MNRNRPYGNRFVKQKEIEIAELYHGMKMKEIKPITARLMEHSETFTINNSKRDMINEIRDSEIERENKLLLNKIESVLGRKALYSVSKTKSNGKGSKSLNEMFRKKKLETIEVENKQLMTRLSNKRATLDTNKMKKEWQQNKNTIKRLTNYEFNMVDFKGKERVGRSKEKVSSQNFENIKISKFRVINGVNMLIKIEVVDNVLTIIGDLCNHKDLKLIELPKEEAMNIISNICGGRLDKFLDRLSYDKTTETLYLSLESSSLQSDPNPQRTKIQIKQRSTKKMAAISSRRNNSVLEKMLAGDDNKTKQNQAATQRDKAEWQKSQPQTDIKSHEELATVSTKPVDRQAKKEEEQNYEEEDFEEIDHEKPQEKPKQTIQPPKIQEKQKQQVAEAEDYAEDFQQNEAKSEKQPESNP